MNPPLRKVFFWSARLLGIFAIYIIARLHLSGVNFNQTFGQVLISLLSHAWVTLILIAALAVAWRWEIIGAVIYILIAGYLMLDMGKTELIYYLFIAVPFAVIALLFLISGLMKSSKPKADKDAAVK